MVGEVVSNRKAFSISADYYCCVGPDALRGRVGCGVWGGGGRDETYDARNKYRFEITATQENVEAVLE